MRDRQESKEASILDLLVQIGSRLDAMDERLRAVEAKAHDQIKGDDLKSNVERLITEIANKPLVLKPLGPRPRVFADMRDTRFC